MNWLGRLCRKGVCCSSWTTPTSQEQVPCGDKISCARYGPYVVESHIPEVCLGRPEHTRRHFTYRSTAMNNYSAQQQPSPMYPVRNFCHSFHVISGVSRSGWFRKSKNVREYAYIETTTTGGPLMLALILFWTLVIPSNNYNRSICCPLSMAMMTSLFYYCIYPGICWADLLSQGRRVSMGKSDVGWGLSFQWSSTGGLNEHIYVLNKTIGIIF